MAFKKITLHVCFPDNGSDSYDEGMIDEEIANTIYNLGGVVIESEEYMDDDLYQIDSSENGDIGSFYGRNKDGDALVYRGKTEQGYVFKSLAAFESGDLDAVCYIPELHDTPYTKRDFLKLCYGSEEIAEYIFELVDWQSPESLLGEYNADRCLDCGNAFIHLCDGEDMECPKCGSTNTEEAEYDTEDEEDVN